MIRLTITLILLSPVTQAKEQTDAEILAIFKDTPVCTDYGTTYGFSFSNLDGYVGTNGKLFKITENQKHKDKPFPKNECVVLPKGYKASIIEKDECYAHIAIHPKKVKSTEVSYLASKMHKPPLGHIPRLDKPNFDPKKIPFKKHKIEWGELAKMRGQAEKIRRESSYDAPKLKAINAKYAKEFKALAVKTMASLGLKKSELEIVEYGYMGCH